MDTVLGKMEFNVGFKMEDAIIFCGKPFVITIKAKAYFEKDGITNNQIETMKKFSCNRSEISKLITELAIKYDKNAEERFVPRTLLFGRNGECALLCDDNEEPDEGIAICVYPEKVVVSQDDYL